MREFRCKPALSDDRTRKMGQDGAMNPFRFSALVSTVCLVLAGCGNQRAAPPAIASAPLGQVSASNFGDHDPQDFGPSAPKDHPVHGIDTSRWQGAVDWPTARANGVNFAFLKATEGGDIVDPGFALNWDAAAQAGVARGAYHFWYHCRPAAEQARWFIRHVPRSAGALPPVLDMEWTPFSPTCTLRPSAQTLRAEARIFLEALEAHYGQRPLIYTTPDFYQTNEMWRVGPYEFWLRSVAAHPKESFAGRAWTFWQYTGTGKVPGVRGNADINAFHGSQAEWAAWLATRAR
jgi:lysozyme